ncbi:glutaredoxin family protein [Hydrogenobaculum acidophilum]
MGIFTKISILGIVWVALELVMGIFHKSVCTSSGCTIAASYNRYPEFVMLTIGILLFIILGFLKEKKKEKLLDNVLIGALASEGYLQGFEIFTAHTFCIFCTVTFLIILTLFIIRVKENKEILLKGFSAFFFVFFTVFMVNNPTLEIKNQYTLLYLPGCPHCEHAEKFLDSIHVDYNKINASKHKGLLMSMGISEAPVLFVREPYGYKVLVGSDAIESFFNKTKKTNSNIQQGNNLNFGGGCQLNNVFGNSCSK